MDGREPIRGLLACLEAARARREAHMCERLEHGFFNIGCYAVKSSRPRWPVMLRWVKRRANCDHSCVRPSVTRVSRGQSDRGRLAPSSARASAEHSEKLRRQQRREPALPAVYGRKRHLRSTTLNSARHRWVLCVDEQMVEKEGA